jgi:hypothetical protein
MVLVFTKWEKGVLIGVFKNSQKELIELVLNQGQGEAVKPGQGQK